MMSTRPDPNSASAEPGGPSSVARAARTWSGMRTLVLDLHDRRKAVSAALGISFIRAKALRMLTAAGPLTMRELASLLGTDAPYTTLIVDDLEQRGLAARSPHPEDRRSKIVTATQTGSQQAEVANRILDEPPTPLLELDPDDLATLDRIIAKMLDAFSAKRGSVG
jgi:DNA-binding MarR family transcriptional regulator